MSFFLQPGFLFSDRYELVNREGVGGFSQVWSAKDQLVDNVVAVKIYATATGLDEGAIKMFRDEFKIALELNHSNLLKPFHFDVIEGRPFIIMPFCEGGTLKNFKIEKNKSVDEYVANILEKIGGALNYLHDKKILHRDIKPENILLRNGNLFLSDFGITMEFKSTLLKATTPDDKGRGMTISYGAPEQFAKKPNQDAKSDIFSFGVMLYELIEGKLPWGGKGGSVLLAGAQVPQLENGSRELSDLVASMMSPDPLQRPTADQLVAKGSYFRENKEWLGKSMPLKKYSLIAFVVLAIAASGFYFFDPFNNSKASIAESNNTAPKDSLGSTASTITAVVDTQSVSTLKNSSEKDTQVVSENTAQDPIGEVPAGPKKIRTYANGLALFRESGKYGLLKNGDHLKGSFFDKITYWKGKFLVKNNGRSWIIDASGNEFLKNRFEDAKSFNSFLLVKSLDGSFSLYDGGLNKVTADYDLIYPKSDGMFRVKKGGKFGFLNSGGSESLACIYDSATDFNVGKASVEFGGLKGEIDKSGIIKPL